MFQNYFQKPIDEKDEKENMDDINFNEKDYIKIETDFGFWCLFFWFRKKVTAFRSIKKNEMLNVSA